MNSDDFRDVNATLQIAAIHLGLHQACDSMKETYVEALNGKKAIYSYLDAQCHILDHFFDMITYRYSIFGILERNKVDINMLKKKQADLDPLPKLNDVGTSV
ncbi:unnamed protein product [Lactuca virosa]|uniref:Uncharacterized protein n=1 Tax=Lactuca virosa TaxID=75947 RepID=A0AAU9NC17_9ASTR|nr:unnamed protein product [Lactuca virosa]